MQCSLPYMYFKSVSGEFSAMQAISVLFLVMASALAFGKVVGLGVAKLRQEEIEQLSAVPGNRA